MCAVISEEELEVIYQDISEYIDEISICCIQVLILDKLKILQIIKDNFKKEIYEKRATPKICIKHIEAVSYDLTKILSNVLSHRNTHGNSRN